MICQKTSRILLPLALLAFSCASNPPPHEKPKESLLDLVENQNLEKIRSIFGLDTNVDSADTQGRTALHLAAEKDLSDIAAVLLARGATVDLKDKLGKTPLQLAVENNAVKTIPLLIQYKASLFSKDNDGRSPLQTAMDQNATLVPILVTKENVGSADQDGNTPLHLAAIRGDQAFVDRFLALGAVASVRNASGMTAADLALQFPKSLNHAQIAWTLFRNGAPVPGSNDLVYFGKAGIADDPSLPFDQGNTPLDFAASRGQTGILEFLVKKGAAVDSRDIAGNTPLHQALENNQIESAKKLIELGADVNLQDFNNNTALHIALTSQDPASEVSLLLQHKADPNLKNNFGNTPLHMVVALGLDSSLLTQLINSGADVNARNKPGNTPLFDAVHSKKQDLVAALRKAGANIFAANNTDQSPLTEAIRQGNESLSWLVDKANIGQSDDNGNTALHLAILAGDYPAAVSYLLDAGANPNARNKKGQSPLHLAVAQQNLNICLLLLKKGSDLFLVDNQSLSPLQLAFQSPPSFQEQFFTPDVVNLTDSSKNTPLFYSVYENLPEETALLLRKGALVNAKNLSGKTPLHETVRLGRPDLALLLIKSGADLTATDKVGNTPLHELIDADPTVQANLGDLLLQAGANLEAKNTEGRSVLDLATQRGQGSLVGYLLDKNANPNSQDKTGRTPVFEAVQNGQTMLLGVLLSRGGHPGDRDQSGTTPLHVAASQGNSGAVALLIRQGADPFAENRNGESPTSLALRSGSDAWKAFFTSTNVNRQNNNGQTALHLAVLSGVPPAAIQTLLGLGADQTLRDKNGKTALDLAREQGKTDLVQALMGKTPSKP